MHNKVCKMALGVHSKASNHAVKGELGRFPLHLIINTGADLGGGCKGCEFLPLATY